METPPGSESELTCSECGAGFKRPGSRGPAPTRCQPCKEARKRALHVEKERRRAERRRRSVYRCGHCKQDKPGDDFSSTARYDGGWCRECYRASYVERSGGTVTLECKFCGVDVEVTRRGANRVKYCSRSCKDKAMSERKRQGRIALKTKSPDRCLNCQSPLPPDSRRDRRYCNQACSHEHNAERRALVRRRSMLRRTYGITLEQYDEILRNQGGRCAICRTDDPGSKGVFHVDHCHDEGHVRGLLCSPCNTGLGQFRDNIESLVRAVNYVARARDGIVPGD